ncbi:serpin family protein [Histomonas meleagridis]|nr:serpin family protein [Histomonas meleagridis]
MAVSITQEPTRKQALEALKIRSNSTVEELLTSLKNLMGIIGKEGKDSVIKSGNNVWPNKEAPIDLQIYNPLVQILGVDFTPVSFPQPGCDIINQKIEELTSGLIQNLLDPSMLPSKINSVLTNAIYFNSKWKKPFIKKKKKKGDFKLFDNSKQSTSMMTNTDNYFYTEDSAAQVLSMEYVNDFSMVVVLPKKKDLESFRSVKSSLNKGKYQIYIDMLGPQKVNVQFPKFKHIWGTKSLLEMLRKLGIVNLFDESADPNSVSDIVQKAVIEVDEEKTVAAAATAAMTRSLPAQFVADHPFLYFITHKNGTILFAGSYIKPEN